MEKVKEQDRIWKWKSEVLLLVKLERIRKREDLVRCKEKYTVVISFDNVKEETKKWTVVEDFWCPTLSPPSNCIRRPLPKKSFHFLIVADLPTLCLPFSTFLIHVTTNTRVRWRGIASGLWRKNCSLFLEHCHMVLQGPCPPHISVATQKCGGQGPWRTKWQCSESTEQSFVKSLQ